MKLEKQIVVFLDILGFSSEVKKNPEKTTQVLLDKILPLKGAGAVKTHGDWTLIKPEVSALSDSIVLTLPSPNEHDAFLRNYLTLTSVVSNLFARLLSEDSLLLRGAISCGKIYHSGGVISGEAVVEAVEAEKSFASMPRIILCDSLIKEMDPSELRESHKYDSLRDFDGAFYVDWLCRYSEDDNLAKVRKAVMDGLSSSDNQKNYLKWCWVANYLNTHAPEFREKFKNFEQIKIPVMCNEVS